MHRNWFMACHACGVAIAGERPGGIMGEVIRFPEVRQAREAPTRMVGASADIMILPVVRIERAANMPLPAKTRPAGPAARSPLVKAAAKSAASRKRRKRGAQDARSAPARKRG
jgi:hypothetical protein